MKRIVFDDLTPREIDVIRIMHFGFPNNLGLSEEYFNEILQEARKKLRLDTDAKRR